MILLHAGTNDLADNVDPAGAPARLGALLDQIRAERPTVTVLLATVTPANKQVLNHRIVAFNRQLPGIMRDRRAAGTTSSWWT